MKPDSLGVFGRS